MTSEEIKEQVSMRDVLSMYGIHANGSGMCSCPWHKDRKPSMKIFRDGFKCFSCGANGDIFRFVQEMENCSFKQAFIRLGGTYEDKTDVQHILIRKKFERTKERKEKFSLTEEQLRNEVLKTMRDLKAIAKFSAPFSDLWCWSNNLLFKIQWIWEEKYVEEREVNEIDVYRICREVRQKVDS